MKSSVIVMQSPGLKGERVPTSCERVMSSKVYLSSPMLNLIKDGRYLRQSLEQAVDLAADLIAASECHHPIPPPSQISSRGTERETSASDNNRSRCYCCSFINENRRALDSHQKLRSFGLFNVAGAIQQRQKGRKMMSCLREGCNFQTRQAPSRPQLQGRRARIERLQ